MFLIASFIKWEAAKHGGGNRLYCSVLIVSEKYVAKFFLEMIPKNHVFFLHSLMFPKTNDSEFVFLTRNFTFGGAVSSSLLKLSTILKIYKKFFNPFSNRCNKSILPVSFTLKHLFFWSFFSYLAK